MQSCNRAIVHRNANPTTQSTYTIAGFLRQYEVFCFVFTMLEVDLDTKRLFNSWFRYTIHSILTRNAIGIDRLPNSPVRVMYDRCAKIKGSNGFGIKSWPHTSTEGSLHTKKWVTSQTCTVVVWKTQRSVTTPPPTASVLHCSGSVGIVCEDLLAWCGT